MGMITMLASGRVLSHEGNILYGWGVPNVNRKQ